MGLPERTVWKYHWLFIKACNVSTPYREDSSQSDVSQRIVILVFLVSEQGENWLLDCNFGQRGSQAAYKLAEIFWSALTQNQSIVETHTSVRTVLYSIPKHRLSTVSRKKLSVVLFDFVDLNLCPPRQLSTMGILVKKLVEHNCAYVTR